MCLTVLNYYLLFILLLQCKDNTLFLIIKTKDALL
nr:MAG TPA: hypothetical protein [Caudoviricetes sp.]